MSVALGVIAGKCGSLRLVLGGPAGCLRGRWRSGLRKWCHAAGFRARGQQAPRTCRCVKAMEEGLPSLAGVQPASTTHLQVC